MKFYATLINEHLGEYVEVDAVDYAEARAAMFHHYARGWGFLYESPEEAGVEQYGQLLVNRVELRRGELPQVHDQLRSQGGAASTKVRGELVFAADVHTLAGQVGLTIHRVSEAAGRSEFHVEGPVGEFTQADLLAFCAGRVGAHQGVVEVNDQGTLAWVTLFTESAAR